MQNEQMTQDDIRDAVRAFVAKITEQEPGDIADTADFTTELGIDSLMAIEMMVSVNKRYKIQILDEEFVGIRNVNDAVTMVQRHLAAAGRPVS